MFDIVAEDSFFYILRNIEQINSRALKVTAEQLCDVPFASSQKFIKNQMGPSH